MIWAELSSEIGTTWAELSWADFLWAELSWADWSLGRVVLNPSTSGNTDKMIQKFVLNFFFTLSLSSVISSENQQDCTFDTHLSGSRKKGENQIEILKGKRYPLLVGGVTRIHLHFVRLFRKCLYVFMNIEEFDREQV